MKVFTTKDEHEINYRGESTKRSSDVDCSSDSGSGVWLAALQSHHSVGSAGVGSWEQAGVRRRAPCGPLGHAAQYRFAACEAPPCLPPLAPYEAAASLIKLLLTRVAVG